jgi:hypothetical protein
MTKHLDYPACLNGFKAKTINVRTVAGGTKFLLQQINELGLPHDAEIYGLWCRNHDSKYISSNGLELVDTGIFENAYLNLKDRGNVYNKIDLMLGQFYLPRLAEKAYLFQPIPSALIDWNQSFIQINPRVSANDDQVFEIVVLYDSPGEIDLFPNRFIFRDGLELAGVREESFEINLNDTQREYSLSNTNNVGLPTNAIVLGFYLKNNNFPLYGKESVNTGGVVDSVYFTLKHGTELFIDHFPVQLNNYEQLISSLNYFPIVPTQVQSIDWQQSKIKLTTKSAVSNDMVFQFSLIWYSKDC